MGAGHYSYDPLRRGTSSASTFGAGELKTTWSFDDADQVQRLTLPGNRTYQIPTGPGTRWARDGTPLQLQRPDGKIFHQSFNDQGQLQSVYGAGTFAQKYGYNAIGDLETLTTYSSGLIDGAGAATTTWHSNAATGQNTGKSYPGETDS